MAAPGTAFFASLAALLWRRTGPRRTFGLRCGAALLALLIGRPEVASAAGCDCGDPLLSATDPVAVRGRLVLGLETEYLEAKSGPLRDLQHELSLRLGTVYRPFEALRLVARVPLVHEEAEGADGTETDLSGLSDVDVGARLVLFERPGAPGDRQETLAVLAGSSLPTGLRRSAVDGRPVSEQEQLGSGAFGPYLGLSYRSEGEAFTWLASAAERLQTGNGAGYHRGNSLVWSLHGQWGTATRLAVDLGIDGRHAAPDGQYGQAVANTGGTILAFAPALYLDLGGPIWFEVRGEIPLLTHLFGSQNVGPGAVAGLECLAF